MAIPSYLNNDFFKKSLENGFRELDVQITDATVKDITVSGENYISRIYRATVNFVRRNDPKEKRISLIIKTLPMKKQEMLQNMHIYEKETLFYLDIKPQMDVLMWKNPGWQLGAKHFYSTSYPKETIVLEDLCEQGYALQNRQLGLNEEHCQMVLRKLGQYHALSMVLAERNPEIVVKRFPLGIVEGKRIQSPAFKGLFGAQLLKLISFVSEWKDLNTIELTRKLHNYNNNLSQKVHAAVDPLNGGINVLNHGDVWVNNLLFKASLNGKPADVRLIDFQLGYYGSLGYDFNYFFYTSVQLDVMKTKREALIKVYHKALADTLTELKFDRVCPSLEDVAEEIRSREAYGFFVSYAFFPMMTMRAEDSQGNSLENFHDKNFAEKKIELMFVRNKRTLETLRYTLQRFDQLGILD